MSKDNGPKCGGCYYFTFLGLRRVCATPETPRFMDSGGPAKCEQFVASDTKRSSHTSFPILLSGDQLKKRLEA